MWVKSVDKKIIKNKNQKIIQQHEKSWNLAQTSENFFNESSKQTEEFQ